MMWQLQGTSDKCVIYLDFAGFDLGESTNIKDGGLAGDVFELNWTGFGPVEAELVGVAEGEIRHKKKELVY
jgi:hypothetical protein